MRGDPEPKQVRVAGIYFFVEVAVPAPVARPLVLSGAGLPPTPAEPRHPGKFACAPGNPWSRGLQPGSVLPARASGKPEKCVP